MWEFMANLIAPKFQALVTTFAKHEITAFLEGRARKMSAWPLGAPRRSTRSAKCSPCASSSAACTIAKSKCLIPHCSTTTSSKLSAPTATRRLSPPSAFRSSMAIYKLENKAVSGSMDFKIEGASGSREVRDALIAARRALGLQNGPNARLKRKHP